MSNDAKTPREIAIGAVDRICAYDGRPGGTYEATAERASEFQKEFIIVMAERLAAAVLKGPGTRR